VVARRWLGVVAGFDARPEGVESFAADGLGLALDATIFGALGIVVLGLVDWGCQRWRLERALRMTRRELLDERRAGEGDPELRRAWRRRGRSLLRRWLRREATERDRDANGDRLG
jgi:flagellar biosynthesis protein FlhB